jgi:hypothetical protein
MAPDDRFKKVQDAGTDFLETARAKAEDFLRELSKATGDTQGKAQGALDDLVVGGRKGTEQFVSSIRAEIKNQLSALGLATKSDLADLEQRLSGQKTTASKSSTGSARAGAGKKTAGKSTAGGASSPSSTTAKKAAKKTAD